MNPVFTLNYPELLVAETLQKRFKPADGYSVLIPLSAQQKGYDLILIRRGKHGTKVVTFQVKSSRTYQGVPGIASRTKMQKFLHNMWFKTFNVPPEADFFILIGLYASNLSSQKSTVDLWVPYLLLFTQDEMTDFMSKIRQKKQDKPSGYFYFGFDKPDEAFLTRGHNEEKHPDFSDYVLARKLNAIESWFK